MMPKLTILITGAGSPGIAGTIFSIRNNYDNRNFFIITTDIKEDAPGKYLSDKFYVIPPATKPNAATPVESIWVSVSTVCAKSDI